MFAHGAARLCGLAAALLGWRPPEFWAATPAELESVIAALVPPTDQSATAATIAQLKELFPDG